MTDYEQLMKIKRLKEQSANTRLNQAKIESQRIQFNLEKTRSGEEEAEQLRAEARHASLINLQEQANHRDALIQHQKMAHNQAKEAQTARAQLVELETQLQVSLVEQRRLEQTWRTHRKSLEKFDFLKVDIVSLIKRTT